MHFVSTYIIYIQGVSLPEWGGNLAFGKKNCWDGHYHARCWHFLAFLRFFHNTTPCNGTPCTYIIQIWWLRLLHMDFLHKLAQWTTRVLVQNYYNMNLKFWMQNMFIVTPPNFRVCAQQKVPAKCFKLCHILYIRKPKVAFFILCYLIFSLLIALVYVDIDIGKRIK